MRFAMPTGRRRATTGRLALTRALLVIPMVLALGVVVQSKPEDFRVDSVTSNKQINERTGAYLGVVRDTDRVVFGTRSGADLRQVAQRWWGGYKSGELRPIPDARWDEMFPDGARGQIRTSADRLSAALLQDADRQSARGNYDLACRDAVLASLCVQPLKYSDLESIAWVGVKQRQVLGVLEQLIPHLSESARSTLRRQLYAFESDSDALRTAIKTEKRVEILHIANYREMSQAVKDMPGAKAVRLDPPTDLSPFVRSAERNEEMTRDELTHVRNVLESFSDPTR